MNNLIHRKSFPLLALLAIFSLGIFIRLYNIIPINKFIYNDLGRDFLVAREMANGNTESNWISPLSSWRPLSNTPIYFWFISFLYSIFKTPELITIFHSLLSSSLILIAYKIGTTLENKYSGLLIAILTALSPAFISSSRKISQFSLLPLLMGVSLLFVLISNKTKGRKSIAYLILSFLIFIPSLLMHSLNFIFLIGFSFIWAARVFSLFKKKILENKIKFIFITSFFFLIPTLIFIHFAYQEHSFNISEIISSLLTNRNKLYIYSLKQNLEIFVKHPILNIELHGVGVFLIINAIWKLAIKKEGFKTNVGIKNLFILLACFLITGFFPNETTYSHYFYNFYFIWIILLVSLTNYLSKKLKYLFGIFIIIIFIINNFTSVKHIFLQKEFTYSSGEKIAEKIIYKNGNNSEIRQPYFKIILPFLEKDHQLGEWPNGGLWYILEKKSPYKHIKIVDQSISATNVVFTKNPNQNILICIESPKNDLYKEDCLNNWKHSYGEPLNSIGIITESSDISYYIFESLTYTPEIIQEI